VPITITKAGSYVLGGNLKVTDPTIDAIRVAASNVTIDLNGFTIEGPPKGPTSHGAAIQTVAGGGWNVVVKNGVVRGFFIAEAACIHLGGGGGHRVEDVRVYECGGIGIYVDGVVTRCDVSASGSGIGVGAGGSVTDNVLHSITYLGIHTNTPGISNNGVKSGGVTILRNTFYAQDPASICIWSLGANRIEGNTCHGGWQGLVLTDGANYYAGNLIIGAVEPVVDGGGYNIDGGTIDPALSNVIVPNPPAPPEP
jgi:hypothetical protein